MNSILPGYLCIPHPEALDRAKQALAAAHEVKAENAKQYYAWLATELNKFSPQAGWLWLRKMFRLAPPARVAYTAETAEAWYAKQEWWNTPVGYAAGSPNRPHAWDDTIDELSVLVKNLAEFDTLKAVERHTVLLAMDDVTNIRRAMSKHRALFSDAKKVPTE